MHSILIVDDHKLIFDGLKNQVALNYDFLYAPNLTEARKKLSQVDVDCCILDVTISKENGFDLLKEIADDIPVFILTMHNSFHIIQKAKTLGARGFFLKEDPLSGLFSAIENSKPSDFLISESIAQFEKGNSESAYMSLSPREKQVFRLLAENYNYKQIAERLTLSKNTVNNYKTSLFGKMKFSSMVDLTKKAIELGLVLDLGE